VSALGAQLERLEEQEAGARAGDGEALRRFRIAIRRARLLLRESDRELRTELRWLGGTLGPVRDLDALLLRVRGSLDHLDGDRAGGERLVGRLEQVRAEIAAGALSSLDGGRYRALLDRFRSTPSLMAEPDPEEPVRTTRRELKRLREAYAALADDGSDEALHRVRLKAKRVRYAAERGEGLDKLAAAARTLQDVIGAHHDSVVAEERIRSAADDESALAAGRLIELEREQRRAARDDVPRAWKKLRRAAKAL
jgi:CHAD domain-containing protein